MPSAGQGATVCVDGVTQPVPLQALQCRDSSHTPGSAWIRLCFVPLRPGCESEASQAKPYEALELEGKERGTRLCARNDLKEDASPRPTVLRDGRARGQFSSAKGSNAGLWGIDLK